MSNSTFVPESGLTTENNVSAQSNIPPKRTTPGITPPAVLKEADKVSEELNALGGSIQNTGHPIGRYHSFFYNLLTWKHPRASGLIFTTLLSSIVFTQFVNVPKFLFRALWIGLASSTALEVAGRFVFQSRDGLATQFAPKEYFTISRSSMDPIFDEAFSLVNFTLLEFQRLLFVRNVRHTSIAFVLSFIAYNLIKFLPLWALTMVGIVLAFSLPPVYLQNQKAIDAQLNKATEIGSAHYNNAVETASKHANAATEKARLAAIDLGNKAGVDVHRYLSTGPVQNKSVTDEVSKQTKNTSHSTSVVEELSTAPGLPKSDGVHSSTKTGVVSASSGLSEQTAPTSTAHPLAGGVVTETPVRSTEALPKPIVEAIPHV